MRVVYLVKMLLSTTMIGITAICEMIQNAITNEFDVSSSVAAKATVSVFAWSVAPEMAAAKTSTAA
jgi:hypothetical protein